MDMCILSSNWSSPKMLSVGKLFSIAAIVVLILGLIRRPRGTGFFAITIRNRSYGVSPDFWAFSIGAIFAVFAAVYYWFPIFFSRSLSSRISHLHFWLSTSAALAFLLLPPGLEALGAQRNNGVAS